MRKDAALFTVLLALFAAARLWGFADYCLDCDEIWSLKFARHDWGGLLVAVADDVSHPPLFYLLLKGWMALGGESVGWLRLFPVLTAIACVGPLVLLCRALRLGWAETNLALALLAANAFLIEFAQQLRMFDLLQFFALGSLWLLVRFADGDRRALKWLTLVNVLLVYSHYWGWLVVGTEGLYLLLCRREKVWAFAVGVVVTTACFLPWVIAVAMAVLHRGSAVRQIQWIGVPGWAELVRFSAKLTGGFPLAGTTLFGLALFAVPVLIWAGSLFRRGESERSTFALLALVTTVPPLLTYVASRVLPQSVWAERQLIFVVGPFAILVAAALLRLPRPVVRLVPAVCVAWAVTAGVATIPAATAKIRWDRLVDDMVAAEPGDRPVTVYASDPHVAWCLQFYLDEARRTRYRVDIDQEPAGRQDERFWIAYRELKPGDEPVARLTARGYQAGSISRSATPWQTAAVVPVHRIVGGEEADKPRSSEK